MKWFGYPLMMMIAIQLPISNKIHPKIPQIPSFSITKRGIEDRNITPPY